MLHVVKRDLSSAVFRWSKATPCLAALLLATGLLASCARLPMDSVETVSGGGQSSTDTIAPDPMALGRIDAPLALIEFSDYQCTYCRTFHVEVLPRLKSAYIDTGKLVLVFKDLPLTMHKESQPAAVAARCAAAQGKFWEMNEALFANQSQLGAALYPRLARSLVLDGEKFQACLTDPATQSLVQHDIDAARYFSITGTPGFVIGRREGDGMRVQGIARQLVDFDTLSREIDRLLAAPSH